ncbi:hypothetical protein A2415_04925 [candidate division WWE3 bacterium RIFOXYC1_FULL_39_7]|uniref:Uncharacterized protein n=2 Tax=Katanobacteria TaxID=422282 RepID=A0A1F4X6U2_UNCKA|nr:MAG: hypothetical protein A2415_04925 [candidate division WWE3 bacterium RIFOXYC1_FULL_39_7]OGC77404.1 MAG: hypothetical protein A2619_03255 [candidate division WWE3 bacterium RIFOXYD1_FULL_39_9]
MEITVNNVEWLYMTGFLIVLGIVQVISMVILARLRNYQKDVGNAMLNGIISHQTRELLKTIGAGHNYTAPLRFLAESIAQYAALTGEQSRTELNNKLKEVWGDTLPGMKNKAPLLFVGVSRKRENWDLYIGEKRFTLELHNPGHVVSISL